MDDRNQWGQGPSDIAPPSPEEIERAFSSVIDTTHRRQRNRRTAVGAACALFVALSAVGAIQLTRHNNEAVPVNTTIAGGATTTTALSAGVATSTTQPATASPKILIAATTLMAKDGSPVDQAIVELDPKTGKQIREITRLSKLPGIKMPCDSQGAQITLGYTYTSALQISPDSTQVETQLQTCNGKSPVFTIDVAGGQATALPDLPSPELLTLRKTSRDGSTLLLGTQVSQGDKYVTTYSVTKKGSTSRNIVAFDDTNRVTDAAISDDGKFVYIFDTASSNGTQSGSTTVYKMSTDRAFKDPTPDEKFATLPSGFTYRKPTALPNGDLFVVKDGSKFDANGGNNHGTVTLVLIDHQTKKEVRTVAVGKFDTTAGTFRQYQGLDSDDSGHNLIYLSLSGLAHQDNEADEGDLRASYDGGTANIIATNISAADWK